jgi:hypothetical protein
MLRLGAFTHHNDRKRRIVRRIQSRILVLCIQVLAHYQDITRLELSRADHIVKGA